MLIGEFTTKIGVKKRIAIPKTLRKELGQELILTRGYEGSLVIVNKKQWANIAKEIMTGSYISKDIRDTTRFLVGGAVEIQPDKQGRFVIPKMLFDHAQLKDTAIFVGLVNWVEIWNYEKWQARLDYINKNADTIAEEIKKMTTHER